MEPDSHIIIGPDGRVLAATGQVPPALLDARLEDFGDLSPEIREAAAALVEQLRSLGSRAAIRNVVIAGRRRPARACVS